MTIVSLFAFPSCREKETDYSLELLTELNSVQRLELGRMTVGKVGMITDPPVSSSSGIRATAEALVNSMKIGTRIGVYSYDTYLVAYINLGKLSADDIVVDDEAKSVRLHLPPVEIMTDGRDVTLLEEHSRVTGLRSRISPQERARLKEQMAAEVRRAVQDDSSGKRRLREAAERKARVWLTYLFENRGYTVESIEFED